MALLLAFASGWMWRDHQFNANRYLYTDVLVLDRYDAQNFTLQPARMGPIEVTTCTPVDWKRGEKMKHLHFQWTAPCDRVDARGSFEFYAEHGKRLNFTQEILNAGY